MLMNSKLIGKGRAMSVQTWTQRPQAAYTSWEEETKTCKTFHHKIHEMEFQNELTLWRKKQKATKKTAKMQQNQPMSQQKQDFPQKAQTNGTRGLGIPDAKGFGSGTRYRKNEFSETEKAPSFQKSRHIIHINHQNPYGLPYVYVKNMEKNVYIYI